MVRSEGSAAAAILDIATGLPVFLGQVSQPRSA
jgi:hypothetical protein